MRAPSSILPLRLENVSFEARGRLILERVSLELLAGSRTVILGANGAGKSVLMRIMHGLLEPTGGRLVWNETDPARLRARQAMVFQRPVMLRRSALANVAYGLALAERPARVLSGGEQQRLALARAWALRPQVLFLDEPTANLDPSATAEVERIVAAIHDAGAKIVMSTHNLGQAKRLADEILFLHAGRLVERAAAERFFTGPASGEAAAFIKGELPWV